MTKPQVMSGPASSGQQVCTGRVARSTSPPSITSSWEAARRTTEGFLRGTAKLDGLDDWRGHGFELAFQNEWAIGWQDGVPRVMTPDLICVLDSVSGEAIGTEVLRYGQRVTVVALPAPPVFLSARGLDFVGPRAFGYDLDFRSVFEEAVA